MESVIQTQSGEEALELINSAEACVSTSVYPSSVFQRVPRETWIEIFRFTCLSKPNKGVLYDSLHPKQPCWILTEVCHEWRRLVESLPGLWAHIHIHASFRYLDKLPDTFLRCFQRILTRTAQVPLELQFDFTDCRALSSLSVFQPPHFEFDPDPVSDLLKPLLDLLLPHYQRWRYFDVSDIRMDFLESMLERFRHLSLFHPEFTQLRSFRHSYQKDSHLPLTTHGVSPRFPSLASVDIRNELGVQTILSLFPCEQLEDVQIISHSIETDLSPLIPHFTRANRITLMQPWQNQSEEAGSDTLVLSNLNELSLSYWNPPPAQQLLPFLAPHLTILAIDYLRADEDVDGVISFLQQSGCSLKLLHIHRLVFGQLHLLHQLLHAIPKIVSLSLGFDLDEDEDWYDFAEDDPMFPTNTPWAKLPNTFVKLMGERREDDRGLIFCPRLETLYLRVGKIPDPERLPIRGCDALFDHTTFAETITKEFNI
jgi:hypothetical protein